MFAKLKKKIAEEAATAPRTGVRMPRSYSKESITSVGADSGDDFASDGSSSRDDLSSQILRRNDQIRKLEAKLSDYAEQLRLMQKTKDKLEIALEKHQDSSMRKLQDQNETHQANRAKMAEGMALALDKKDQEWMERISTLEQEKASLSVRLDEMMEQSLTLFQKRDDLDELEGFQQQELAKVKHMVRTTDNKVPLSNSNPPTTLRERVLLDLQEKISSLERRLHGNLSEDELLQELLKEVSELEVETLTLQQTPELCELDQNGTVTVDDLDHMQKANRDLEQQLSDKNKTIKQLQQRLAELKRTLQKELKLKPETESDGKERAQEGREERPDRIFTELTLGPAPGPNTTVTNTSDLNDSREINFEYLKHVVLKFMSSREAEAYQLIRAVSVLLNFTGEEEDMLKQTLEYKVAFSFHTSFP
uniref:GRIP domain-containing protein n=1 Tax=Oncorhynchus tshawytscha TaxID=74940 RepID=A0A8C8CKY5_ONCTS